MNMHGEIKIVDTETPVMLETRANDYSAPRSYFEVTVNLNNAASREWQELFIRPNSWVSYPTAQNYKILGDKIQFTAEESDFARMIDQLKDYIIQANNAWDKYKAELQQKEKLEEEYARKREIQEQNAKKKLEGLI